VTQTSALLLQKAIIEFKVDYHLDHLHGNHENGIGKEYGKCGRGGI
jgi:hypothetical protein